MEIKRFSALIFILILASLMPLSSAGRGQRILIGKPLPFSAQELSKKHHHRILRVTTNDYGNYEPSPSLSKPPFKLIPN
ncbi:uncharacterized protein LOC110031528 [Phalaenopsis equestris]|uniref:uncharacterized protein LOC110031528 n=1 Tax=Phalaenopsis equestris TaxID=78828 RepID=UPI0009E2950F|nr:uncharacterized protein LOC110031528 [Phalaenopsis equestris]